MFPGAEGDITDCFFEFVTYGLIGMLRQWIDTGQKLPKKQLAELADKAVMGTAYRLLANQA